MQRTAVIRSLKARFGRERWLSIVLFLLAMGLWRVLEGESLLGPGHIHHLAVLMALGYLYALSPVPWQWTGDGRPRAPFFRALAQALAWNLALLVPLVLLPMRFFPEQILQGPGLWGEHLSHPLPQAWAFAFNVFGHVLTASLGVGWLLAREEAIRSQRLEAEAARRQLEALARQAQFQSLQAQLDPHVLYNSLSGIAELIHEDAGRAERAVLGLSGLYRRITELGRMERTPLARERELVAEYLELEGLRLGGRLRVRWDWEPALDALELPPLLLQPLVENAVKHGLSGREEGGELRIAARRDAEGRVRLAVSDDGAPLGAGWKEGTGLSNLRARLSLMDDGSGLELRQEGGWVVAELRLGRSMA